MLSANNQTSINQQLYYVEHDKFCDDKFSIKNGWYSNLSIEFMKKHEICLEKCKCNYSTEFYCNKCKWKIWSQLIKAWLNKFSSDQDKIAILKYFWEELITPTEQDLKEFNPQAAKWEYDVLRSKNYNANNFERYILRKWKRDFLIKEIKNFENYWIQTYKTELNSKQIAKRVFIVENKNNLQKQLNYLNNNLNEARQKLKFLLNNDWPNSICKISQNWINLLSKQLSKIKNKEFKLQSYNWKWQTAKCCCNSTTTDFCNKCKWTNFINVKNTQLNQKTSNEKKIDVLETAWKILIEPTFKDIQNHKNEDENYNIFNIKNYVTKDLERGILRTWKSDFIINKIKKYKNDWNNYYRTWLSQQQYRIQKKTQKTKNLTQHIITLNSELHTVKRDLILRRKTHWPRFIREFLWKQIIYLEKKKNKLINNIRKQALLISKNHVNQIINKEINM